MGLFRKQRAKIFETAFAVARCREGFRRRDVCGAHSLLGVYIAGALACVSLEEAEVCDRGSVLFFSGVVVVLAESLLALEGGDMACGAIQIHQQVVSCCPAHGPNVKGETVRRPDDVVQSSWMYQICRSYGSVRGI